MDTRSTLAGINSLLYTTLMALVCPKIRMSRSTLHPTTLLRVLAVSCTPLNIYKPTDRSPACNLGYVYGNVSAVSTSMQGSSCGVIAGGDNVTLYECECCELSWPI